MAATAGLSLTLDPMGKMFQNASSSQLKPNCLGITGRSSTKFLFIIEKAKLPPQECSLDGPLQTLRFLFFVPIRNSKWRLRQDLV